jgi:hypothetical protein
MATDLDSLHTVDRLEVVESVRPRLADVACDQDIEAMINAALDDLTPATVTTYLPILVERQVRSRLDPRPPA